MAKSKKKKRGKSRSNGHYCKICDTYKSNEKFSGKGHAAHICKSCAKKSLAEKSESLTINKLNRMAFRFISKAEVNWLRECMLDNNLEISDLAKEIHNMKFPYYERNEIKKTLMITDLDFRVSGNVYDEFGDESRVNVGFTADASGKIVKKTYGEDNKVIDEQIIEIRQTEISKFFRVIVNDYNIFFWDKDLCDEIGLNDFDNEDMEDMEDNEDIEDFFDDEYVNIFNYEPFADENKDDAERKPSWMVNVKYKNGIVQETKGFDDLSDEVMNLFIEFNEYFEDYDFEEE